MATDFQFVGIDETLEAYESRSVDAWALFAGKRMIIRGTGIDSLKKFLTMISNSGTVAVYTLKVYETVSDDTEIKSNTPDDGSFNFKIHSLERGGMSGIIGRHYGDPIETIADRLDIIEEKLSGTGTVQDEGVMSQITTALIGMLQEPRKLNEFIGALSGNKLPPASVPSPGHYPISPAINYPQTVAGVSRIGQAAPVNNLTSENSLQRIGDAIEAIGKHDERIVEHLEKLAKIARENPQQFKTLLILLDGF